MSLYYKYDFCSPAPLIALVQEELRSYFESGSIDSLLFPIYIDKCLRKLGKGSYPITMGILNICAFQARLPDDFFSVREAWLCTNVTKNYQLPNAQYQQVTGSTSTRIDTPSPWTDNSDLICDKCSECQMPDIIKAVYKTTNTVAFYYQKKHLLKPGNIYTKNNSCSEDCLNFNSSSDDTFDIHDNKFTVNFREGNVYMQYYSKEYDQNGYQMIPDNYRIKEFIEAFLKQKAFEQLSNQVTDETYNQMQQKAQMYKQMSDEAYIIAQTEAKKETLYDKHRKIIRDLNRFNKYRLPY